MKDAFHEFVIHKNQAAVNPAADRHQMAAYYQLPLKSGESAT